MCDKLKDAVRSVYRSEGTSIRDRPRFFDQVEHQTNNVSIGNKHFFTK